MLRNDPQKEVIMKRIVVLVLVTVMCLSLCACGKSEFAIAADEAIAAIGEVTAESGDAIAYAEKLYGILTDRERGFVEGRLTLVNAREAYETILVEQEKLKTEEVYNNAKDAYTKLKEVAKLCENGMDDIYNAWHFGIYSAEDSYNYFYDLSKKVNFTSTELKKAAELYGITESKAKTDWNYSVIIVEMAHVIRGDHDTITKNMEGAQKTLQILTEQYGDYTYYPKLKEYYSAIGSYVEFFKNPTGSFNQLVDTVNNFENNIRTLETDVAFLFTK